MALVDWPELWSRIRACGGRAIALRATVIAAGWWILGEGHASLGFGVPVVLAALLASFLAPSPRPPRFHVVALVRFALAFASGSVRGGLDVARRALAPRLPISPAVVEYTLHLPEGAARDLFLGTASLMPGSLCLDLDGSRLHVHVLADHTSGVARELELIERRIARALGEPLEGTHA
ncbi:MAG TPA: Na+/H+ antiporter subunit E [Kofleriaceae bacterium]